MLGLSVLKIPPINPLIFSLLHLFAKEQSPTTLDTLQPKFH